MTQINDCISLCWECRNECQKTLYTHCLPKGGDHAEAKHVRMMMDCIDLCQTAADAMTRQSMHHNTICAACADICEACADSCALLEGEIMKDCADLCRRCARMCRAMSQMEKAA